MRLRNCLGMIWSVSMFEISSGAAMEVRMLMGCMKFLLVRTFCGRAALGLLLIATAKSGSLVFELPVADVGEVACDGGGGGHLRRDEVRASATALAAFEVAVAGAGAAFSRRQD